MRVITLFIPGLFGSGTKITKKNAAAFRQLDRLLARATYVRYHYPGFIAQLFTLFAIKPSPGVDLPAAPVSYLGDTGTPPQGYFMRADPVHLTPGYRGLILSQNTPALTQNDALTLTSTLQETFKKRKMRLEAPTPMRWYIRLKKPAAVCTHEINTVIGHDIRPFLPTGPTQADWHQLLNEVQMQLHATAINKKRQSHGQLPVNSVWFWGGGQLPEIKQQQWSTVYTDDVTTKGLAKLSNTPFVALPTAPLTLGMQSKKERILIVISAGLQYLRDHDQRAWISFLAQLEKNWLNELTSLLKSSSSIRIELITERGIFILNKYSMLKFWRNCYFKYARR